MSHDHPFTHERRIDRSHADHPALRRCHHQPDEEGGPAARGFAGAGRGPGAHRR